MRQRIPRSGVLIVLAAVLWFGFGSGPASAQENTATIEVVPRVNPDRVVSVYPAQPDGTAGATPAYQSSARSFEVEPGCWVLTRVTTQSPIGGAVRRDQSRPYVQDAVSADNQQHAVCLEPGDRFVLDTGPENGPSGFVPTTISFMTPGGALVTDGVTVTYEYREAGRDPETRTITVDETGTFELPFPSGPAPPACAIVLAADHPLFTFPGFVGGTTCATEDAPPINGNFVAVGQAIDQAFDPATISLDLEHSALRDGQQRERFQIQVQYAESGWPVFWRPEVEAPDQFTVQIGAGCYDVRLWVHDKDVMMAEASRAFRSFPICLAPGQDIDLASGDIVLANVDGSHPFVPVLATDDAGAPVPGVQADLFAPRQDLSPDDLRAFDHQAGDARGVFGDSAITGPDGRALLVNYTECQVATLTAPDGWQFSTGRWLQRTVCEDGALEVELSQDGVPPPPPPLSSIGGAVTDTESAPVAGVVVDLFRADADGNRLSFLRSSQTNRSGRYALVLDEPGCHVVTFVAPPRSTWRETGGQWLNQLYCVAEGEDVTEADAVLVVDDPAQRSVLGGTISETTGRLRSDVAVDRFEMAADGNRGRWLEQTRSGADGEYRFDLELAEPACFVLTFIAPEDETWVDSGTGWLNQVHCVEPGQFVTDADAVLALDPNRPSSISGTIFDGDGQPVAEVAVDLYTQVEPFPTRGQWLGQSVSDADGLFRFEPVELGGYLLVYVAPEGETWFFSDTRWLERPTGINQPGEQVVLDAHLN